MPHIFISYPDEEENIVGNLRGQLQGYGIEVWAYSYDKTLAEPAWLEIETKIKQAPVMIFIASEYTEAAEGQQRELDIVLNKISAVQHTMPIFPVVIRDFKFSDLPESIRHVNGERLTAFNVKTVSLNIAQTFFPGLFDESQTPRWAYPRPGEWLEISKLDSVIEEYCDLGDQVYFRRISPMGLFECYFPKIKNLFWFSPDNLKRSTIIDEDGSLQREEVPSRYRCTTLIECERKGFALLFKNDSNSGGT